MLNVQKQKSSNIFKSRVIWTISEKFRYKSWGISTVVYVCTTSDLSEKDRQPQIFPPYLEKKKKNIIQTCNSCKFSLESCSVISPYSVWMREIRTRKTSNTDTFHVVYSLKRSRHIIPPQSLNELNILQHSYNTFTTHLQHIYLPKVNNRNTRTKV